MTFVETKKKKIKQKKQSVKNKRQLNENKNNLTDNTKKAIVPNYVGFCMMSNVERKIIQDIDDEIWRNTYNRLNK